MRLKSLVFLCPLMLSVACNDGDGPVEPKSNYLPPTSPENLIENIQIAYRERDCEGYAKVLAPEFRFYFQHIDEDEAFWNSWEREPDSAATCELFKSSNVSDIRISLADLSRDTIDTVPPVDTLKIQVSKVSLQVDQKDGITWLISGQQGMFFRKGMASSGESPNHWFLYEWYDHQSFGAPGAGAQLSQEMLNIAGAMLKLLYAPWRSDW